MLKIVAVNLRATPARQLTPECPWSLELFFQNPDFGFYFMKLASERLFNVVKLQEQELAKRVTNAADP